MTTSSPSSAPGSMMAVGWIWLAMASVDVGVVHHGEHEIGGGDDLAADAAFALGAGDAAAHLGELHQNTELVAGTHGLAPLDLVAAHEERGLAVHGHAPEQEHAGGLRHGLDLEHAGHDRVAGIVALEERFVDGH